MKTEDFADAMGEFMVMYAHEYAEKADWKFISDIPDTLEAEVEIETFDGEKWCVPISITDNNEAAIDIGDAGFLNLDAGGLYCFLWHEACKRLRIAKDKLITIAEYEERKKEESVKGPF